MPIGLGAWVPLVAGYRARHPRWILTGVATLAFTIFAFAFSSAEESNDYGGGLLILAWVMAGATSFALRRPYARRKALQSNYDDQIALAEHIDGERRAMTALATRDPRKAVGLGVGRPDLPGSRRGHLVDVNHAPAHAIGGLPGVGKDQAVEIVALRRAARWL